MTDIRTVLLTGQLTDADIAEFVAVMRRIDDANPTKAYGVVIDDRGKSLEEAADFVAQVLPPRPDRVTTMARAAYRNDSCPPRPCDRCGESYRGPAVYCSFACAMADA